MPSVGPMELVVILVIALVVLGPKRLPDAGRSIGKGMREFKDAISGDSDKVDTTAFQTAVAPAPAQVATPAAAPTPVVATAPAAVEPVAAAPAEKTTA